MVTYCWVLLVLLLFVDDGDDDIDGGDDNHDDDNDDEDDEDDDDVVVVSFDFSGSLFDALQHPWAKSASLPPLRVHETFHH